MKKIALLTIAMFAMIFTTNCLHAAKSVKANSIVKIEGKGKKANLFFTDPDGKEIKISCKKITKKALAAAQEAADAEQAASLEYKQGKKAVSLVSINGIKAAAPKK